jgi:CheY-like chemotaxis protein
MGNLRLLIVDDSSLARSIIKDTVEDAFPGVYAELANDGDQAQKMLLGGRFDLVLCDWEMPTLKGNELLQWMKENPLLKEVPFIMITVKGDKDSIMEAKHLGVTGYIIKPFTTEHLCQKVGSVLKSIGWSEPQGVE